MSGSLEPGPHVPAGRARRGTRRRRTRTGIALALVAVVVVAGWFVLIRDTSTPDAGGSPAPRGQIPPDGPDMLALNVTGGSGPLLAELGGPHPAAIQFPGDVTVVVPGQGDASASDVGGLPGPSMQVALSNVTGVWAENYVAMDLDQLSALVLRQGGLKVNLSDAYPTGVGVIGPGDATMSGTQVAALLDANTSDLDLRWADLLDALVANPPVLQQGDAEVSSLQGVNDAFEAAKGGDVVLLPTKDYLSGTVVSPLQPDLDQLMTATFGVAEPTTAIVQNGNGAPGVGEDVARLIIPAGFRVTLSQNAQNFDVATTELIANGTDNGGDARRARRALGVGRVSVSQVPSGVGDITIVVGKDFTA